MAKKTYVEAVVCFDTVGHIVPTAFWIEGARYEVDRVLDVRNATSTKVGGVGVRYLVSVSSDEQEVYNKRCHLWFERGEKPERWFVVEGE